MRAEAKDAMTTPNVWLPSKPVDRADLPTGYPETCIVLLPKIIRFETKED
jgi:hypothetical protein